MLKSGRKIKRAKSFNLLMKISVILPLLLFCNFSQAAVIPNKFKSLLLRTPSFSESVELKSPPLSSKDNLYHLPFDVSALENWKGTNPILSRNFTYKSTAVIISSKLLRKGTIADLGIKGFNYKIPLNTTDKCFLPINTKSMLIFNQPQPVVFDSERSTGEIPFDFDDGYHLMDYNLLVPFNFSQDSKINGKRLAKYLELNKKDVLFSNSSLEIKLPFLVIMFNKFNKVPIKPNKGDNSNFFESEPSSKIVQSAFDMFSKNWFRSQSSANLIHLLFCVTNNELMVNDSICFDVNNHSVNFFPPVKPKGGFTFEKIKNKKVKRSIGTPKNKLFNSTHPFSVQLGNPKLDPKNRKFTNLTKCKAHEKYEKPMVLLKGSLIGLSKHYSKEMLQLCSSKRAQIFQLRKRESADQCEPVTWFNIFHRSLFGSEVEFCEN